LSQVSAFETGKVMSYETFDFKRLILTSLTEIKVSEELKSKGKNAQGY
jgi:hypothetical protein